MCAQKAGSKCLKRFFLERAASFSRFFLEIEPATLLARCRAIMYQRRRGFFMAAPNASEIPIITYRLNSPLFSRRPPIGPHLGPGRTEDCNSSDRQSSFCFNFRRARQYVLCAMLAKIGSLDRLDNILTVSRLQYSWQWWGQMSR